MKIRSIAYLAKKHESNRASTSASEQRKGKLSLVKSFSPALTTEMQISNIEIKDIINTTMKNLDVDTELNK